MRAYRPEISDFYRGYGRKQPGAIDFDEGQRIPLLVPPAADSFQPGAAETRICIMNANGQNMRVLLEKVGRVSPMVVVVGPAFTPWISEGAKFIL